LGGAILDSEVVFIFEESPEGGLEAHAVGYSIYTQADTFEELTAQIEDALRCHFECGTKRFVLRRGH
jgi:hypothetical protein